MAEGEERLVVEWTSTAESQFFNILNYWITRNKSSHYSEKLSSLVWKKTKFISRNPYASKSTGRLNTRIAALGHFSIVYKIEPKKIVVVAFWDNRQDPKKLYEFLKNRK